MSRSDSASPTVLIPGLACGPDLFTAQLPTLWDHGPVTVADHTRGASIPEIARRVLHDAPPTFALGALAMGGYIAFEIMRQEPERVTRLALLGTSARPTTDVHRAHLERMLGLVETGGFEQVAIEVFPTIVHSSRRDDEQLRLAHARMVAQTGPEAYSRQVRANMGRIDSRPSLGEIGCPTLVLVGDEDEKTPLDYATEIADAVPNSELVVVPRCGHLSTMEQPDAVNEALARWLSA